MSLRGFPGGDESAPAASPPPSPPTLTIPGAQLSRLPEESAPALTCPGHRPAGSAGDPRPTWAGRGGPLGPDVYCTAGLREEWTWPPGALCREVRGALRGWQGIPVLSTHTPPLCSQAQFREVPLFPCESDVYCVPAEPRAGQPLPSMPAPGWVWGACLLQAAEGAGSLPQGLPDWQASGAGGPCWLCVPGPRGPPMARVLHQPPTRGRVGRHRDRRGLRSRPGEQPCPQASAPSWEVGLRQVLLPEEP